MLAEPGRVEKQSGRSLTGPGGPLTVLQKVSGLPEPMKAKRSQQNLQNSSQHVDCSNISLIYTAQRSSQGCSSVGS